MRIKTLVRMGNRVMGLTASRVEKEFVGLKLTTVMLFYVFSIKM